MLELALPAVFAIGIWWLSTCGILFLDGLNRRTFPVSLSIAGIASLAAFAALYALRDGTDAQSAYLAFTAALVIWGWNEMAFLMGFVTGPRRIAARPGLTGWARFREATAAVIWHELAIAASGALIALLTWGEANQVGLWTFLVLWLMRLSAKLNIFLGAPNVPIEFLPDKLAYLGSYFRKRPMNGLFPIVITLATAVTFLFAQYAIGTGDAFVATTYSLLATMMALAVLEHWLLFVPISTTWMWRWGLGDAPRAAPDATDISLVGVDSASAATPMRP